MENKFICYDCLKLKKCKESASSWIFFIIAVIAVISTRLVNIVMDFSPVLSKAFWYLGIISFFIFFLHKYRYSDVLQKEISKGDLNRKLLEKEKISDADYELLATILCKSSSKIDKIDYFIIFSSSIVAILIAVYLDFLR